VSQLTSMKLTLNVNGNQLCAENVRLEESLLFVLRERLGLWGSKNACEQGECGSCSILLDGVLTCSCLVLASQAEGRRIETADGLPTEKVRQLVAEAFCQAGAVQCGFCTPGFVMAVEDVVRSGCRGDWELRERLSGNLCRCTGYGRIIEAVQIAIARHDGGQSNDRP
jgi:carbon-monoxide dehydrogenase small subunit